MQIIFFKENVAIALASTEYRDQLTHGDTLNKPYRSAPRAQTYSKGVDMTIKDRFATNEYLSVDTAKVVPFYVDDLDKIQNKWDSTSKFAQDGQRLLNNILDQAIAGEAANAGYSFDAGSVGGSSGSGIVPSVSNVSQIFTAAARILDAEDVPQGQRFALIGSRVLEILRLYIAGRETGHGDTVGNNGRVMQRFGFDIFYSNNVYFTATLGQAAIPTVTDTVTINGATLEWVADADVVADDAYLGVLRTGNADTDRIAMVACINDTGTVGTTYSDPDAENEPARWKLEKAGVVATNDSSNDEMTIVAYGDIVLSSNLADGTDGWASETSYPLFGLKGATDLVVQKTPNVDFRFAEKRLGRYVYPWMLYGKKTFADMAGALVYAEIDASAWS